MWNIISAERRALSTKYGVVAKLIVAVLVTRWAYVTVEVLQAD